MSTYREDMARAWARIESCSTQRLETRFGVIEYADHGHGAPLLVAHGVLGCHVDAIDSRWAELHGPRVRVIAPSRFGYFRSTLPENATPDGQADAYAMLLEHLGVHRAVVLGFSAGSGSVLEFARRYPEQVSGLILACCRLGGGVTVSPRFAPLFRVAYRADRLFWILKKLAPSAYSQMMGVPKAYHPTPAEAAEIAASRDLLFSFKPRSDGAVFDGFVSNLVADQFPLEQLAVPTLVISAKDDPLAPYEFAVTAAGRIPDAQLVTIEAGGHLFIGHEAGVRDAISSFIRDHT